ncbi:MAG: class I SAM-dependent methyltransferase [Xanthobacteraceae bacterium]|nr:class I SAM-dependent methyltransferase [Xanthobacteraceae bacterium]
MTGVETSNNSLKSEQELITSDGTRAHFYLASGYQYRQVSETFDDRANRARWQDHVYAMAHKVAVQHQCRTILDIGCGSGFKLVKYFSGFNTIGIERSPIVQSLRLAYPDRIWLDIDEGQSAFHPSDIYICADVIEHIQNPEFFLQRIAKSPFQYLVISTPAREILFADGRRSFLGPPDNPAHFFEWTMGEFHKLLSNHVAIMEHSYFYNGEYTQIIVAKQKG